MNYIEDPRRILKTHISFLCFSLTMMCVFAMTAIRDATTIRLVDVICLGGIMLILMIGAIFSAYSIPYMIEEIREPGSIHRLLLKTPSRQDSRPVEAW